MRRSGFTLAEVLITLGIVGVISAMLLPSMINKSTNANNASKLSSIVATLDNAFGAAIIQENVPDITETAFYRADTNQGMAGELAKYAAVSFVQDVHYMDYYAPVNELEDGSVTSNAKIGPFHFDGTTVTSGEAISDGSYNDFIPMNMKNGAVIFIARNINSKLNMSRAINNAGGNLVRSAAYVVIDVNGRTMPNRTGRDIFWFMLGDDGVLYPYGGRDVAIFNAANNNAVGAITEQWNMVNSDTYKCLDRNIGTGHGCTARLIEQGYKVKF